MKSDEELRAIASKMGMPEGPFATNEQIAELVAGLTVTEADRLLKLMNAACLRRLAHLDQMKSAIQEGKIAVQTKNGFERGDDAIRTVDGASELCEKAVRELRKAGKYLHSGD